MIVFTVIGLVVTVLILLAYGGDIIKFISNFFTLD